MTAALCNLMLFETTGFIQYSVYCTGIDVCMCTYSTLVCIVFSIPLEPTCNTFLLLLCDMEDQYHCHFCLLNMNSQPAACLLNLE